MSTKKPYEGGSLFTIRFPSNTPITVLNELNKLRNEYGRGFTSKVINMWEDLFSNGKHIEEKKTDYIQIKMPGILTEDQRKTLDSKEFQDTVSSLAYFLLTKTITPALQQSPIFYGAVPTAPVQQTQQEEVQQFPSIQNEEAVTIDKEAEEKISKQAMDFATKNLFDFDDD